MKSTATWCTFTGYMPIPKSCWRCAQRAIIFWDLPITLIPSVLPSCHNGDTTPVQADCQSSCKGPLPWMWHTITGKAKNFKNMTFLRGLSSWKLELNLKCILCSFEKDALVLILEETSAMTLQLTETHFSNAGLMLSNWSTVDIVSSQTFVCLHMQTSVLTKNNVRPCSMKDDEKFATLFQKKCFVCLG